jgi:hypothetical protein
MVSVLMFRQYWMVSAIVAMLCFALCNFFNGMISTEGFKAFPYWSIGQLIGAGSFLSYWRSSNPDKILYNFEKAKYKQIAILVFVLAIKTGSMMLYIIALKKALEADIN